MSECQKCIYWVLGQEWGECVNTIVKSKKARPGQRLFTRPEFGCPHYESRAELARQISEFRATREIPQG